MNFLNALWAKIQAAWGKAEPILEAEGEVLLNAFQTVWLALQPGEMATLYPIIMEAIADVADGDIADIETQVLMKAETAGITFLENLGSGVLQALIGIFKAAPATTPAASTTAAAA